jgi:arsenate reductase-like glutaredoxin family protein
MKKIYYLSTCDTCKRIMAKLQPLDGVELQDIKEQPLLAPQLEELHRLAGSYEALFSKRARRYREEGLHEKTLTESDYRKWLLEHYTFLNRPVIVSGEDIFIGSSKKNIASAMENLHP